MANRKKTAAPKKKKAPIRRAPKKKSPAKKVAAKKPAPAKKVKRVAKRAPAKKPKARVAKRPSPRPKKPAPRPKKPAGPPPTPNPIAYAVAQRLAQVAVDKKASDVVILSTGVRASAVGYDYVVLISGDSDRQLTAIADAVREHFKPFNRRARSVEVSPDWVAMDFGDVLAHAFLPERRGLTDLEGMWADAPRVPVESTPPALEPLPAPPV